MSNQAKVRRYGFACLTCRRKKVRCDGVQPECQRCLRAGDSCIYKTGIGSSSHDQHRGNLQDHEPRDNDSIHESYLEDSVQRDLATTDSNITAQGLATSTTPVDTAKAVQSEITIDEHGFVAYFGTTSRFHHEPAENNAANTATFDVDFHRKWLTSNSRFQTAWEKVAYDNLAKDPNLDPTVAATLLRIYWTWQAPLHNCVYRACFFRDMALGGSTYFSPFLLNTIYAHASRHIPEEDPSVQNFERGDSFLRKAKLLLVDELGRSKPQLPTIQGLLILGGRQCAVGQNSEGWLYTGMAIRMIKDLGLHLNMHKQGNVNVEPEDLEARKRLFLSAYSWDKSISLCLGRPPSLTEMPYKPDTILDQSSDNDRWSPFYLDDLEASYPMTKCLTTVTFIHFCELAQIINEGYNIVYGGGPSVPRVQEIFALEDKLRHFHTTLPDALRIVDLSGYSHCPPPHIFCLNILYHTLLILIYRPFLSWREHPELSKHSLFQHAHQVCIDEATKVNSFFECYGRTFAFRNQTYLISYCVYTAATVELHEVRYGKSPQAEMAAKRLATTLKMLETEARQTPGVKRSVEIIRSQLDTRPRNRKRPRQHRDSLHEQNVTARAGSPTSAQQHRPEPIAQVAHSSQNQTNLSAFTHNEEASNTGTHVSIDQSYGAMSGQTSQQDFTSPTDLTGSIAQDDPWMGWDFYDLSGGFAPETTNWTWQDMVM